ncbi:MAG: SDR family oxidoreductase [Bacteroidota bacterium]
MNVLFIGGTGFISTAVSKEAIKRGMNLYLLNRGLQKIVIPGSHSVIADVHKPQDVINALKNLQIDVAVDWIAFTPEDIERDLALFHDRIKQFIFISSASAYQKPPTHYIVTESTPLHNPYWDYSRNKIACEQRLMQAHHETGFPVTIVRPSFTYDRYIPVAIGGFGCYTLADRMKKGKPIIVHGDGSSLWVMTHAEDFACGFLGLVGNNQAVGHAFHITSDEVLTWNQIYQTIAGALGVEANMVYIPSDFIIRVAPQLTGTLMGDKTWSVVFDNSKIKSFVPGFQSVIPFREGIRRTVAWLDADETRRRVDVTVQKEMDEILRVYAGHPVR